MELEHCCEINAFTSGSFAFGVANEIFGAPYKFEKLKEESSLKAIMEGLLLL